MNPLASRCAKILAEVNDMGRLHLADKPAPQDGETELLTAINQNTDEGVLRGRLTDEFFASGPLMPLIEDSEVTEILINGPHSIWFEKNGRFTSHSDHFLSMVTFTNFVHRLCQSIDLVVDLSSPCGDGQWDQFRVHVIQPPLSNQVQISLRRHPPLPWTLEKMVNRGWTTSEVLPQLRELIHARKSILVVGSTGSGKTSVLNAFLQELPQDERVICIEDTSELHVPNPASCKLLTRREGQGILKPYDLSDLLRQSLRMRPTRLVLGEVRGAEAKDLLLSLATGHKGSMGTMHADDSRQALLRLEMLVQLGAQQWDTGAIRQLIQLSLDYIVVVEQKNGVRKLKEVSRIAGLEKTGFLLESLNLGSTH